MSVDHLPGGPAALLRVAGIPAGHLEVAGNPELFDGIRRHAAARREYRRCAAALAELVGEHLIPHTDLPEPLRALAICLRRRLFRGDPVAGTDCRRLTVASSVLGVPTEVTGGLLRAGTQSDQLSARDQELSEEIHAERDRLAALPWQLAAENRVIAETAPDLLADIRERLARGEDWDTKRMRQRADYLMRLLGRAAFKTTPRGWAGQVAAVSLAAGPGTRLLTDARVGQYAMHEVTNIQTARRALATAAELADASLSMTGLHWTDGDRLCCWVADPEKPDGLRFVRVRRTPAVDAVRQVLGSGAMRTSDVIAVLAPGAQAARRKVIHDFLLHLVRLGVVQISALPAARLHGWSTAAPSSGESTGFVDVYRRGSGRVRTAAANRIAELLGPISRLQALLRQGEPAAAHPVLDLVTARPRTITDIVAEFLDGREPRQISPTSPVWPSPRPGTAYQRLCDWLTGQADASQIDITEQVLDRIGAPPAEPPLWPVDCLVRPMTDGGPLAVLEAVLPAGVLDARFADALRQLHGRVPQVDSYRAFLDATAARCGVEFVEILVPPQADRGANAVRRPGYTTTWTGDADWSTYLADTASSRRYLPLNRITVRTADGQVIAEDPAGRRLWPVYHATRVPPAPWDLVVALLTAASPIETFAGSFVPGDHTAVFAGQVRVPRLVLEGTLVLAGRSVRIERQQWPSRGAAFKSRVRALAELGADVPRWNFVRAAGGRRPRPVDLASLTAIRAFDRVLADPAVESFVLEEMLPAPHQFAVHDAAGDPIAAQLLLRLPSHPNPDRMADRLARAWRAAPETTGLDNTVPGATAPETVVAAC